jgi:hypothetical protein
MRHVRQTIDRRTLSDRPVASPSSASGRIASDARRWPHLCKNSLIRDSRKSCARQYQCQSRRERAEIGAQQQREGLSCFLKAPKIPVSISIDSRLDRAISS